MTHPTASIAKKLPSFRLGWLIRKSIPVLEKEAGGVREGWEGRGGERDEEGREGEGERGGSGYAGMNNRQR